MAAELYGLASPGQLRSCLVLHNEVVAYYAAGLAEARLELLRRKALKVGYRLSQLGLNGRDLVF